MVEDFGSIIGFIGSVISIGGAVISVKGSRNAKILLREINIKESAIEIKEFKEKLDNLYFDISKPLLAMKSNRGSDGETKKCKEWFEGVSELIMNLPNEFKDIETKLEEVREILKDHAYEEKSLHETQKDNETMFQYLEGLIYGLNKRVKREPD